jgi:hypothetical protein
MRTKLRSKFTLLFMTCAVLLAIPAIALADIVANNLDATVDTVAEEMPLQVGGDDGTTKLYVINQNTRDGDTNNACNLAGNSTNLQLDVTSSNTDVATVDPASVTINDCTTADNGVTLTVTPVGEGSTTITVARKAGTGSSAPGTFNYDPATFTVNVSPPPNTPPEVTIDGVTGGASYNKGSVPAATCQVTDTEDGNSSFPATLSAITGTYASDGIGSQTASCSYTDNGPGPGLTATSSVIYNIVDPSAPVIGYTLNPASADGSNGWYKGNVSLTWNVSEPQSPSSLQKTGCVDQNITADQAEQTYSCSATSAGGSAGPETVTIKRDGTNPVVSLDGAESGTAGNDGWYTGAVSQQFKASDATSGLLASFTTPFTKGSGTAEGSNVSIASGAVSDNAGNTNNGINAGPFKIDLTKPTIQASLVDGSNDPLDPDSNTGWYNLATGAPTAHYECDDVDGDSNPANGGASGVVSCGPDHLFGSDANAQSNTGKATDNAGLSDTASVNDVKVDLSKPTNIAFQGGPAAGGSYDPDSVPAAPTCTADDTFSNLKDCVVTGYSANAGTHTLTATATDNAGNVEKATRTYEVKGWTLKGFYHPVDMLITNTVKAGQTVPLKFEMLEQVSGDERTNPADVKTFAQKVTCGTFTPTEDAIEEYSSGSTSLRYDTTGGQFIFNWQTPKAAGSCFKVTMTPNDTSSNALVANFKLK